MTNENTRATISGMPYTSPVILDDVTHATVGIDAAHVRERQSQTPYCQINVSEFEQAAACFPIVFSLEQPHVPLVVMSLEKDKNLFAHAKNGWNDGIYMPKGIAQYPICTTEKPDEGKGWPMAVDAATFASDQGERLFETGKATLYLKDKVRQSVDYTKGHSETIKFCTIIESLDLFKRVDQTLNTAQGPVSMGSFMIVDIEKLNALLDETRLALRKSGVFHHIELHAASLLNFDALIARTAATQN